jgi:hypothetical protein
MTRDIAWAASAVIAGLMIGLLIGMHADALPHFGRVL